MEGVGGGSLCARRHCGERPQLVDGLARLARSYLSRRRPNGSHRRPRPSAISHRAGNHQFTYLCWSCLGGG